MLTGRRLRRARIALIAAPDCLWRSAAEPASLAICPSRAIALPSVCHPVSVISGGG